MHFSLPNSCAEEDTSRPHPQTWLPQERGENNSSPLREARPRGWGWGSGDGIGKDGKENNQEAPL